MQFKSIALYNKQLVRLKKNSLKQEKIHRKVDVAYFLLSHIVVKQQKKGLIKIVNAIINCNLSIVLVPIMSEKKCTNNTFLG